MINSEVLKTLVTQAQGVIDFSGPFVSAPTEVIMTPSVGIHTKSRRFVVLCMCALVVCTLELFLLSSGIPFRGDQNAYLGGAVSLRAGDGYRFEDYIDLPRIGMYPPGYSIWLAMFLRVGQSFEANSANVEIATWTAAGAALFALAACLAISELPLMASVAILLALGSSVVFNHQIVIMSADLLFAAGTSVLALLTVTYRPNRNLLAWWLAAGLLSGVLFLIKTAALAYVAGLGIFGLYYGDLRRLSRLLCFSMPVCLVLIYWYLNTRNIPTYGSFFAVQLADFGGWPGYFLSSLKQAWLYFSGRWLVELFMNIPDRLRGARAFVGVSSLTELMASTLGIGLAIPIAFGISKGRKSSADQISLFVLGATALLFVFWPFYLGARCAFALIPFLATWLSRGLVSKTARCLFVVFLLINTPGNAWLSYKAILSLRYPAPEQLASLKAAADWIRKTGGSTTSVAAGRDVPLLYLFDYLGRRVLANATPVDQGSYVDVLPREQNNQWADYAIVDPTFDPRSWERVR